MKQISLWGLIVVPFVLLATLGGATVYLFSTVTISNVSDNVGSHYMREVETRVFGRVNEFMAPLNTVAEINRDAIANHPEWLDDLDLLAGRFYEQAIPYQYLTFISFASADNGRYVNSTRDPFGKDSHHVATNYTNAPRSLAAFEYDPVSYVGKRIESEPPFNGYDPRTRPFYTEAVEQNGMTWSTITPYFGYPSLGVGLSAPVYDAQGTLLGVTATSVALVALDQYLQSIELVDNAYVFLAEQNGNLIASSSSGEIYNQADGTIKRVSLASHSNPVYQEAGRNLAPGIKQLISDGKRYLYNVRPVELPYGQTWFVGVMIPESYYKNILTEYSQALVLIVLVIFVSIALAGSLTARFIGRPILKLHDAINSNSLERIRHLPQPLSRVKELNSLSQRLQEMSSRLSDVLQNLEQKVAQRTSHLKDENELLLEQSTTDELTGLYNRRGFNLLSEQALQQAKRYNQNFCMVLCDIDHFKRVNDTLGHSVGDQALVGVASILKEHFRSHDIVARYGGEEFMVIIENMTQHSVLDRLNRVRQTLIDKPTLEEMPITLSFGMTYLEAPIELSLEELINDVDAKLYQAKNTGRDRIVS